MIVGFTAIVSFFILNQSPSFADTTIFSDDFSDALAWQQSGTRIFVNTGTQEVNWDARAVDTLPQGISHDFGPGVVSGTEWTLRFKLTINNSAFQTSNFMALFVGMFDNPQSKKTIFPTDNWNGIYAQWEKTTPQSLLSVVAADNDQLAFGTISEEFTTVDADPATHWYELKRLSATLAQLNVYSDAGYTTLIESHDLTIPAGVTEDLRYLNIKAWDNAPVIGPSPALNGILDDIEFIIPSATNTCNGLEPTIEEGTSGDDVITGTSGDDVIVGLGGNDRISGMGGNDTICGGDGDDMISGNEGDDWIDGEAGKDLLFGNSGKDDLRGSANDDRLVGGSENDKLKGNAGNDMIVGEAGEDDLNGGNDFDICDGGSETNTIAECEL
jgi:Ca2+-binding RTX toxin-like protein